MSVQVGVCVLRVKARWEGNVTKKWSEETMDVLGAVSTLKTLRSQGEGVMDPDLCFYKHFFDYCGGWAEGRLSNASEKTPGPHESWLCTGFGFRNMGLLVTQGAHRQRQCECQAVAWLHCRGS